MSKFVANAAVETAAHQSHLFLAQIHRAGHGGDLRVERPESEIILRDVGLQRQQHIAERRERPWASARALSKPRRTRPHKSIS